MRKLVLLVAFGAMLAYAVSASASLPYYNSELGYTIWLSSDWTETPRTDLARYNDLVDGLAAHGPDWVAGYTLSGSPSTRLLASSIHGRVVSPEAIGNFNRYVVRELERFSRTSNQLPGMQRVRLRSAGFTERRNTLRLEMELAEPSGRRMTSILYIVYTRTGMLKFVGLAEPDDDSAVRAIDDAVSSLYLDHGLRQER